MIKATTIEVTFTEAGDRFRGTFETWIGADVALGRIADARRGPGYSKTDVLITWADGEQYKARLDITAGSLPSLARHVRQHCEAMTGRRVPDGRTSEEWTRFLAAVVKPEQSAGLARILDCYALGE